VAIEHTAALFYSGSIRYIVNRAPVTPHQKPQNKLGCQPSQDLILVIQMKAALAHLKVTPTMYQGKQVAEVEDFRAWDQLLALCLEVASSKLQNLKKIVEVVNGRKQLFLRTGLLMLWIF